MAEPDRPPPSRRRPSVHVGPPEDRHNAALARFIQASWGQVSDAQSVADWREREARENQAEPGTEPPKWVFTRGDEVLGFLGTVPEQFHVSGGTFVAYWLRGFQVDPAYRSGPVGFELVKTAVQTIGATAVSTVAPEARRLFAAHGLAPCGVLFNRLRPLNSGKILRQLNSPEARERLPAPVRLAGKVLQNASATRPAGSVVDGLLAAGSAIRGRCPRGVRVTLGWDALIDESLDRLWEEVRTEIPAATVRDARWVRWRYARSEVYSALGVWRGARLLGWAVVRAPSPQAVGRLGGLAVASLSDLLFPPQDTDAGLAVVAAAEDEARRLGADALLCSGSHPALERVLKRRSFLSFPGDVHFMARSSGDRDFPDHLHDWWLTRGDAQSDGAL